MTELLSISIPTRNRPNYLYELLMSIENQWEDKFNDLVKVYIFDNSSNDETKKIVDNGFTFDIDYYRQPQYLNGDISIRYSYSHTDGEYIHVIGDDEILPVGSMQIILDLIDKYNPALLLPRDNSYNKPSELPEYFSNYTEFAKYCMSYNPHILIAHSLISANIIKKDVINYELMDAEPNYPYSNFEGIIDGVIDSNGGVVCCQESTIIVRDVRAVPVDGEWPADIIAEQNKYLSWVHNKLGF